jgi:outer membrane receptor protein involved in Fe transport
VGRDLGYLRYDGDFEAAGRPVEVHATVSFQRQSELSVRQVVAVDRSLRQQNRVDVLGVSSRLRSDLGRGGNLAAGFESNFEWVGSTAERSLLHEGPSGALSASPADARYPNGSRAQTFAFFVQDDIDLTRLFSGREAEPGGRWRALVGGRGGGSFLYIPQDARLSQLRPTSELLDEQQQARPVYSGSLHLRYEPVTGLAFVGGGMLGVRPPSLDDTARLDDGRPGLLLPSRVALSSESAYSAEAGIRTAYRRLEGSVTYAFTRLDNPILVVPVTLGGDRCLLGFDGRSCSPLFSRANVGAASLHSIEAVARVYLLWGLTAFASVAYTRPDATPTGEAALPRVPPVHGVAAVEFRRPRTIFNFVQLHVRWAGPQRQLAAEDLWDPTICPALPGVGLCSGTPGFLLLSVRSALRLSRQIQLTAAIDNITNESYRFHGSGIDGAGIGARLGLDANY